jgi:hypothetical protein
MQLIKTETITSKFTIEFTREEISTIADLTADALDYLEFDEQDRYVEIYKKLKSIINDSK